MSTIRRLTLCLDGTWNNQDSSTNVLHHYALVSECSERPVGGDTVTQRNFYHTGVGTGTLDSVTGGGFGFGLETNVRAAYDWLVQNYEEGDQVYVFGFSRGAHTARLLVGFIGMCGLLRRGTPLTVTQLWENYCLLGRALEQREGLWSRVFGDAPPAFRRITDLLWDPWLLNGDSEDARATVANRVPGQRVDDLNETESLLVRWSRRIKITYLGVYDTVGAVGWDALAIPGVRSKLALHHNLRPTTLILKCRHALAIDEHRSNFQHTPFVAFIGGKPSMSKDEYVRLSNADREVADKDVVLGWSRLADKGLAFKRTRADKDAVSEWSERIEQRWFVGAHSNIGGGYASNRLAQEPLRWLLAGARDAGLICEEIPARPIESPLPIPRDSYSEFARPLWTMVIRARRNYRILDPVEELRADRREPSATGESRPGFSLVSINEQVDPSVLSYWKGRPNPPPNLVDWASRRRDGVPDDVDTGALASSAPAHPWLGNGYPPHLVLLLWATGAAAGVATAARLFGVWWPSWALWVAEPATGLAWPSSPLLWWLSAAAAAFALIDWGESVVSFSVAKGKGSPVRRAFLDSIYWTRALGIALLVCGVIGAVVHVWGLSRGTASLAVALERSVHVVLAAGLIASSAGIGVVLGGVLNKALARAPSSSLKPALWALVTGPLCVIAALLLVVFVGHGLIYVVDSAMGWEPLAPLEESAPSVTATFAGQLFLLQLAVAYFLDAFSWVGEPMGKAHLGSITPLQRCSTPDQVEACLDRWRDRLGAPQHRQLAESGMVALVREALWRDILGFIPVYSIALGFGLWFGAHYQLRWLSWLGAQPWGLMPIWLALPLAAATTDYVEDVCHLRYLALHARNVRPPRALALLSFTMTKIKFVTFGAEFVLVAAVIVAATARLSLNPADSGLRGLLALSISWTALLAVVGIGIWAVVYRQFFSKSTTGQVSTMA